MHVPVLTLRLKGVKIDTTMKLRECKILGSHQGAVVWSLTKAVQ